MKYEGAVYRPPSEAYSLIIQVTIGCAHNKCKFCSMFKDKKFRIRSLEEIFEDLELNKKSHRNIKRIFLADGDALVLKTENLVSILLKIKEIFPKSERVSIYGTTQDILRKPLEDLIKLRELGLGIIYLGLESGSDFILKEVNKGVTAEQMIEAGKKVKESGIKLSATIISGLGGKSRWEEHAFESARVINAINPDYVALLTLLLEEGTPLYVDVREGKFELLNPGEIMLETKKFIENIDVTNCVFRSNHASNYISLNGNLSEDKDLLLKQIEEALVGDIEYKPEMFRGF